MPQNPRGIRCRTSIVPAPPDILGSAEDGGKGGRLLRVGVSGIQGRDAVVPNIPQHLQHNFGCGGATLCRSDGGESG